MQLCAVVSLNPGLPQQHECERSGASSFGTAGKELDKLQLWHYRAELVHGLLRPLRVFMDVLFPSWQGPSHEQLTYHIGIG